MSKITASVLFAGEKHKEGNQKCFFCGTNCDESFNAAEFVKDTFTNRDIVSYPGSKYACAGCVNSLGWGDDEMLMLDGTIKKRTNEKGMAPRMYSWLITKNQKWAFTKAHVSLIRDIILHIDIDLLKQYEPPFSIVLADSGQKHLIFRAPVAMSKTDFPVMLEEEIINVNPSLLEERIQMALPIVAAIGKPVLLEELTFNSFITYEKYHGDIAGLEAWQKVQHEPMSRLAAWLSKSKEDARNECPTNESGRIPEKAGGVSRSGQKASRHGAGCDQGRSDQTLFDIG